MSGEKQTGRFQIRDIETTPVIDLSSVPSIHLLTELVRRMDNNYARLLKLTEENQRLIRELEKKI